MPNIETIRIMLPRETTVGYSENYKNINTLCGQSAQFLHVTQVVHIVARMATIIRRGLDCQLDLLGLNTGTVYYTSQLNTTESL
jgi:hypothetical protein